MEFTVLGSGGPIPHPSRAGSGVALSIGGETLLVDCGPGIVERLVETGIHPGGIEHLFFTHHHMDHNASFFNFAVSSWILGRRSLTLFGSGGTERLVEALELVYEEDFEYRASFGRSLSGLTDIECRRVSEEFAFEADGWRATALPVEHAIETYAYRFEELDTGASVVFSGDTRKLSALADFAAGADVLVHECPFGPPRDLSPDEPIWPKYADPSPDDGLHENLGEVHSTATEAADIAADAGVGTLVLDHLSPYVDPAAVRAEAEATFDGTVIPAEDGMTVSSPF